MTFSPALACQEIGRVGKEESAHPLGRTVPAFQKGEMRQAYVQPIAEGNWAAHQVVLAYSDKKMAAADKPAPARKMPARVDSGQHFRDSQMRTEQTREHFEVESYLPETRRAATK